MKKNLTIKETIIITSMLFGMFFGAGNLIFPAALGPKAGSNMWIAYVGLFITAVGLPLLAVAALGMSRTSGITELSSRVSRKYGVFFSTLLYLTIGPLFAIPRCASTSFSVGAVNLLPEGNTALYLAGFSFLFFAIVLFFSLKPNGIMTWIGKILNPIFLVCLAILVIAALLDPLDSISAIPAGEGYTTGGSAFFSGFLEGYNTLDALAGLAFGIVIVNVVRDHEVTEPGRIAANTAKAGIFSCLMMGAIYLFITIVATQSYAITAEAENGGAVLGIIANHYFHSVGAILMTAIVTFACLKTAIGLVTSCSEAFCNMFPKGPSYKTWAIIFSVVSFGVANFGLSTIVAYCVPVLMFLYPLAITIIILALTDKLFGGSRIVYKWTTAFTLVAAILDFIPALASTLQGSGVAATPALDAITNIAGKVVPFYSLGLGWVCPAAIGFIIGFVIYKATGKKAA